MPRLHLLGTGAALAPAERTTTMLAVSDDTTLLIDCGGDVIQRLLAAGLHPDEIEALLLTHEHPDHVCGFPLFMEKIWLAQRERPIPVCGPRRALDQACRLFDAFDTSGWKGMPEIELWEVPLVEGARAWSSDSWRVTAAPGVHSVPVMGFRIESVRGGGVVTYSADTERCETIGRLAKDADILVHEATGGFDGHATAADAAELASGAGVRQLVLVHLPPNPDPEDLERARSVFPTLQLGEDGGEFTF